MEQECKIITESNWIVNALFEAKLADSKAMARRFIHMELVKVNGTTINDAQFQFEWNESYEVSVGSRSAKIIVKREGSEVNKKLNNILADLAIA